MTELITVFHFDDDRPSFEDKGKPNGVTLWLESVLMESLGYSTADSFRKVILKAKQACLSIGIHCEDHFVLQDDNSHFITRFGCYLIAMNGDSRKPEVASAQAYFAALAETFATHVEHSNAIDRVLIREEITEGQKYLASTAKSHGIEKYSFFLNKGYLGMYNMSLEKLCKYKGIPAGSQLIDRMDKTELAAHLFRITQTDEKIKNDNIRGQSRLESTAYDVGKTVRQTMKNISGTSPEDLKITRPIQEVKKQLKGTSKKLKALDKPKRKAKKKPPNN